MERTRMRLQTDGQTPCWSLHPPKLSVGWQKEVELFTQWRPLSDAAFCLPVTRLGVCSLQWVNIRDILTSYNYINNCVIFIVSSNIVKQVSLAFVEPSRLLLGKQSHFRAANKIYSCYDLGFPPSIVCLGRFCIAWTYIFSLKQLRQEVDSLAQWLEHWIFIRVNRVRIPR